jgi:hypothetical protein
MGAASHKGLVSVLGSVRIVRNIRSIGGIEVGQES